MALNDAVDRNCALDENHSWHVWSEGPETREHYCNGQNGPTQGAPRQAEDEVVSTSHDLVDDRIRDAGVAVRVGSFVPGGAAVRLDVGDLSRWLQPDEAHELSLVLEKAAIAALHEDRAMRHAAAAARTGFGQEKKR